MGYYDGEASFSQDIIPEDEAYAQRAAIDDDDRRLAKLDRQVSGFAVRQATDG